MHGWYDIAIVGGGLVGAGLAVALRDTPARVALIESQPARESGQAGADERGLALSLATQRILDRVGIWNAVRHTANPIRLVHVSEAGRFGCVRLDAALLGLDALGHVVPAGELDRALAHEMGRLQNLDLFRPARLTAADVGAECMDVRARMPDGETRLRCRLLVAADGSDSPLRALLGIPGREADYGQTALVAGATPRLHHADTAYERFAPGGQLAVLPMPHGRCVVVFCVRNRELHAYGGMDDGEFLRRLDERFGGRLGGFSRIGTRSSYPLRQVRPERQTAERVVFMGNAAHTLHPNAAQGLNLGMRDVAGLAEHLALAFAAGADPGSRQTLAGYVESRIADQERVMSFTDGLARLFYNEQRARALARHLCMLVTDLSPPLKRALLRSATGLYGRQPAWVREAVLP